MTVAALADPTRHSVLERHGFEGRYPEVAPPARVVRTFEWDGIPGHVAVETA